MSTRSRANARRLAGAAAVVLLELICRHVGGADDARVLRADFGVSAGVAAVVALLSGLFGLFGGKQRSNTAFAFDGMRSSIVDLGKSLTTMIVAVAGQVSSVLGVVRRFLQKWAGRLYDLIRNVVNRMVRILDKIFGPIIDFLDKVRVHLKKFYDKVLRPILDTIEFVRGVLRLLSAFGFEWSKKLDAKLAELEGYVLEPYLFLVGKLNEISNWINRIVTLDGLLQRVTLLNSLVRDVSYTNNLWWNSQTRQLTPAERAAMYAAPAKASTSEAITELRRHFLRGDADISPLINEVVADIRIELRSARVL